MITEGGSNAGKVLGILLAAVVLLGLAGGAIVLITASGDDGGGDDNEASADALDDEPATTTTEAVDASPPSTQPATTSAGPPLARLRDDRGPAVEAWYDAVGREAQTIRVVLYPTYAFLDVRDPESPGSLVEFVWRDGLLDYPTPEPTFPGTDLDAESYRLSQVNWD